MKRYLSAMLACGLALGTSFCALPEAPTPQEEAPEHVGEASSALSYTWTPWGDLGESMSSAPAIVGSNGRYRFFWRRTSDSHLMTKYCEYGESGCTAAADMGVITDSAPASVSWDFAGRLDVFYQRAGHLKHLSRADYGSAWSSEGDLASGLSGGPAVSSWGVGRLDVFWRSTANQLTHLFATNGTNWSAPASLAGMSGGDPAATSWGTGRIDVFWRDATSQLRHQWYTNSAWYGTEIIATQLGTTPPTTVLVGGSPAASSWGTDRLDVFWRGTNNHLQHLWHTSTVAWSYVDDRGGSLGGDPDAVSPSPGSNIIEVAARGASGQLVHTSYTHCGPSGDYCCSGNTCDSGAVCQGSFCATCGGTTEPCCAGNACDTSALSCQSGTCQACGASNQGCCGGNTCNNGLSCQSGACKPCGGTNQVCCAGTLCSNAGQTCQSGTCKPCGGASQACCAGSSCNNGALTCQGGSCQTCGGTNQACCAGSSCNSSALTCQGGSCQTCGGASQTCCGGSTCNNSGLSCQGGSCQACGGTGQACCSGVYCTGTNTCQSGVCTAPPTCGDEHQQCCNWGCYALGGGGTYGLGCQGGTCEACGKPGLPCCQGTTCIDNFSTCSAGYCQ